MKKQIKYLSLCELDFLVAKAEGLDAKINYSYMGYYCIYKPKAVTSWIAYKPATNPSQAWPIIERERINIRHLDVMGKWLADIDGDEVCGKTSLEASMRCFVASKFGNEVDL
jgi:hypothetical protein